MNLFYNPYQPTIDDYYEPWNYDYETLTNSPEKNISLLQGRSLPLRETS
ncbi:hypothetical protein PO124_13340 [Bacillus licheniformis]|nr:hypothetical protein [Bacillus licheniformis]